MSSDYDANEFVDGDFQSRPSPRGVGGGSPGSGMRAPTREEVDARMASAQQKLAELKRAQEELERERASLEETRRRQLEFQTGRQEMLQNLTRGLGLLEEAELNSRRDLEQLGKTLADFKEALATIQAIKEDAWTQETFTVELTRALTALENARMEWNSARLKFPILSGQMAENSGEERSAGSSPFSFGGTHDFMGLCRLGFALTWPVAAATLLGVLVLALSLLRR